jgi:predicted deacetylase
VTATLIVSLSGLSESTLPDTMEFATELDSRLVPASWLLPPRPRTGRHCPDAALIRWLRSRVEVGDALVLHGFDHTVDPIGRWAPTALARIGRRAEFAALPSHEATLRLIAASRSMDELGLASEVFAPPRWLASAGTVVALRQRGFRVCADSVGVRRLDHPASQALLRGRVLTAGNLPESAETWRYRALIAAAARIARRGGLVRLAVEAGELSRPTTRRALLDAVDAALAAGAAAATYRLPVPRRAPLSA